MNLLSCGCYARCFRVCECGIYMPSAHSSKVTPKELEPDDQLGKEYRENMDENQKQNITQASEQLTDSAQQSFRMLADRTVALQESNLRLTQGFFHNWIEQVNNQAQGTREATQNLAEQGQRQREAVETLSQEATKAHPADTRSGSA